MNNKRHLNKLYISAMVLFSVLLLRTPLAAQNATQGEAATKPSTVTLETSSARFELTGPSQGLLLRSIVDIETGSEFLTQAGNGLSLWEIILINPERKPAAVQAGLNAEFSKRCDETQKTIYTLTWRKLDLPDEPGTLAVTVTVIVPAENRSLSYWYIDITNKSKRYSLWEVRFPRLERLGPVGSRSGDNFLDPMCQGRLTPNPYSRLLNSKYVRDAAMQTSGQSVHYPGYASFQMCALYNSDKAGLYYAAYDGQGYYKRFCFGPKEDRTSLDLYLTQYPQGQGLLGGSYVSPFPVVIGTFKGDWLTAAKIYRQWAENQIWCARGKIAESSDIPQWYKTLGVWEFITENNYAAMLYYRGMLGVPFANHWNYIWKDKSQGDVGSPDLFPPKGGEKQMREETAKLTKAGVYTVPYFLGSALDTKSPQYKDWKMDRVLVHGGESHYALGDPHTPYIWMYPQAQFAWPCPYLDVWSGKAVEVIKHIVELGATGVYLDTTTGNAYQCFATDHGHTVGGGNYWAMGTRKYLKQVRDAIRKINPDTIMTGENPCEIYNDLMDGYLLYVAHFPTSVPAFQAIYHDYVSTYGQFLCSPAKVGQDYPFTLPIGLSFINGDKLGPTAHIDYTMQTQGAKDMAWLRKLAHFRVKVFNRYLGLGEMIQSPKLENNLPTVSGWWWVWPEEFWGTRITVKPAVLHSAWRGLDGNIGIVFLNISEQPQSVVFQLNGEQYGFSPDANLAITELGLSDDEKPTSKPYGVLSKGKIEHTLKPREIWAIEVNLANDK